VDDLRHDHRCGADAEVAGALKPIFAPILPHTPLQAAVFFGVLGGIASIYRGPMVVIGTGAALLAIILANKEIPIPYLYSIWLARRCCKGAWTDQLMDVVDDRAHQGQPWSVPAHRPALRLPHGRVNSTICYLMLGSLQ
jgi:hypothetical protein